MPIALIVMSVSTWACQSLETLAPLPSGPWYTVGGDVTGATGPLRVQCGADAQALSGSGAFTCDQLFASDSNYSVAVLSPPAGEQCLVSQASGFVSDADVTAVVIACSAATGPGGTPVTSTPTPSPTPTPSLTPGPTPTPTSTPTTTPPTVPLMAHVTGSIPGASLRLSVNGQAADVTGNGNTTLAQGAVGTAYTVTIQNEGPAMTCQASASSGILMAPATYVDFVCQRTMSFSTNPAANTVLGQAGFGSSGAAGNPSSLRAPKGVTSSSNGEYLYIVDTGNARVAGLALPTSSGSTFTFSLANQSNFDSPRGAGTSPTQTVVADAGNNLVYIYNGALTSDRAPDVTIGGTLPYCSPTAMSQPTAAFLFSGMLAVADTGSHRILIYSPAPTSNNQQPTLILGQDNGYLCSRRGVAANSFYNPQDVWSNGSVVAVADTGNNRVLLWNTFPTTSGQNADAVLGQSSGTGAGAPNTPSLITLNQPAGVLSDGTTIFVADTGNNRVLGYPLSGAVVSRSATLMFGQASAASGAANAGVGSPSSQGLSSPYGLAFVQTSLAIADTGNNRVLLFNSN